MSAEQTAPGRTERPGQVRSWLRRGAARRGARRTVPAAVLEGSELIHVGGGESIPCPGVDTLPLASSARRVGLGSPALALPPAKVHVLRDVVVCPGSRVVLDRRGRIVAESLSSDMVGAVGPSEVERSAVPVELEGTVALFRSPWRPYFHTLVDHLPRAALLGQRAVRRLGPLTLVHDGPLTAVERYLLSRLLPPQVRLHEIGEGRTVRAERVVLPGYVTRPSAGAVPSWYRRWIDREAEQVRSADERRRRRIFVDRVHPPRRVLNRAALDAVLDRHGIEAVEPSALAPEAQITLFRDAELVVGVTGSGLANTLFSRSAHLVELVPGQELLPHFFYLTASKGLPYSYLLGPLDGERSSISERLRADVVVDVDALDRLLSDRLGVA